MGLVLLLVAGLTLVPAVVMVAAGIGRIRRPARIHRVPVDGLVVHVREAARGPVLTVDYPGPDGAWLRASCAAGRGAAEPADVQRGARMTVWVDPTAPHDVSLGASPVAGRRSGVALVVVGAVWGLLGAAVVAALVGEVAAGVH